MSREGFGAPYEYIENLGPNGTAPWGTKSTPELATASYIGSSGGPGDYYFSVAISPTNIDTPGSRYEYVILPDVGSQEGRISHVSGLPQVAVLENGANRAMSVADPGRAGVRLEDAIDEATGEESTFIEAESELFDFVFQGPGNESSVDVSLNLRLEGNVKVGTGNSALNSEDSEASTEMIFWAAINRTNLFIGDLNYQARHNVGGSSPVSEVTSQNTGFLGPILPESPGGDAGDYAVELNLEIDEMVTMPIYTLPTGEPIRVSLEVIGITKAKTDGGRAMADIQFTGGWHFPYDGPVFNLPEGFTVNALSASVVNNRFEGSLSGDTDKILVPGIFMQAGDIVGESRAEGHEDWIDLLDVSSGLLRTAQGSNIQTTIFEDVQITKHVDKSSPKLAEASFSGDALEEVRIEYTQQISTDLWKQFEFLLHDVSVINFQLLGEATGPILQDSLSISYKKIDWIYRLCDGKGFEQGRVEAFWDLVTNTGGSSSTSNDNAPPSVGQVENQSVDPASTNVIDIDIEDMDTIPEDLTVTVTTSRPDLIGELKITGSGADRTVSYKASALRSGFASITVTISDGTDTRSTSIPVLIDVEMTPYEGYLAAYFDEDDRDDLDLTSPIRDPDNDGIPTIIEFLLGINPREFNRASEGVKTVFQETSGGRVFAVDFKKRLDDPNIQGYLWGSFDLKTWQRLDSSNPIYEESTQQGENPLFEETTATVTLPSENEQPFYLRFQAEDVF